MDFAHVNRPWQPTLPPQAMVTYEANAPLDTHWRAATCAEVECKAYLQGWTSDMFPNSADEARILKIYEAEIRKGQITTSLTPEKFIRYHFPPGTECFRRIWHRLPLERPALFTVRTGDFRGTDGVIRTFKDGEQWVDAFATHQDKIATEVNRG